MSGHKINAMKGVGVLYVRRGLEIDPIITGGGQEHHLRAGTENVPGIVSMGAAVDFLNKHSTMEKRENVYKCLRKIFLDELDRLGVEYRVNVDGGVPGIISLILPHCESEAMLLLLNEIKHSNAFHSINFVSRHCHQINMALIYIKRNMP